MFVWINELSFSFSIYLAWFHLFFYYEASMSKQVSYFLKICIRLPGPHNSVTRNLKLALEFHHIFGRFLLSWMLNPQLLWLLFISLIVSPDIKFRIFYSFQRNLHIIGKLQYIIGTFWWNKGWEGMSGRSGGFYVKQGTQLWVEPATRGL